MLMAGNKRNLIFVVVLIAAFGLVLAQDQDGKQKQLAKIPIKEVLKEIDVREINQQVVDALNNPEASIFQGNPKLEMYSVTELVEKANKDSFAIIKTPVGTKSIYVVDNRLNLQFVVDQRIRDNARATAALIKKTSFSRLQGGHWRLQTNSYKYSYSLCDNVRFKDEPIAADCTGFLVAPDIVATAGHCVKNPTDVESDWRVESVDSLFFVFDFEMIDNENARTEFSDDQVYEASSVIHRAYKMNEREPDWALVKLTRPAQNRPLLRYRSQGKCAQNNTLYVLGYPSGLPLKYASDAKIMDNSANTFFKATLDTFHGNSGSPVINAVSHEVEGILVRGGSDYREDQERNCNVLFTCDRFSNQVGCSGEDVTRSTEFASFLMKLPQ